MRRIADVAVAWEQQQRSHTLTAAVADSRHRMTQQKEQEQGPEQILKLPEREQQEQEGQQLAVALAWASTWGQRKAWQQPKEEELRISEARRRQERLGLLELVLAD